MTELSWFHGPELRTAADVLALVGKHRTDSLLASYSEYLESQTHNELSELEKTVVGVEILQREVNSGGFDHFFEHYSQYLPAAKLGLKNIYQFQVLELLEEAEDLHPEDTDAFYDLDQAYYALGVNLSDALVTYLIAKVGA